MRNLSVLQQSTPKCISVSSPTHLSSQVEIDTTKPWSVMEEECHHATWHGRWSLPARFQWKVMGVPLALEVFSGSPREPGDPGQAGSYLDSKLFARRHLQMDCARPTIHSLWKRLRAAPFCSRVQASKTEPTSRARLCLVRSTSLERALDSDDSC